MEILDLGKDNLGYCKSQGGLKLGSPFEQYPSTSSHSLSYLSQENPPFVKFLAYAHDLAAEDIADSSSENAEQLLAILRKSVVQFNAQISISNNVTGSYVNVAVLHHIDIQSFIETYLQLSSVNKNELARGLEKRYQFDEYARQMLQETPWLIRLRETILNTKKNGKRTLSRVLLEGSLLIAVEKAIKKLESLQ